MAFENIILSAIDWVIAITTDPLFLFKFITHWGWLILLFPFLWMAHVSYVQRQIGKDRSTWKHILLAIDVPKNNETGPKAVENIFAHLAGAHGSADIQEIHLQGRTQRWFSFEIVSIEGFVQFIIWTEVTYRSLIESAIYAQYPEAEITEVEDYTKVVPSNYPNDEWDLWGADFKLVLPYFYPIKSYTEYEDGLAGVFHDPMTALVETMSRMGPGEQLWMQTLIKPIGISWKEGGQDLINELAGRPKEKKKPGPMSHIAALPGQIVNEIWVHGFAGEGWASAEVKEEKEMPSKLLHLTTGEKSTIEAIENKLAKIGFGVKIRIIYIGKKGYFKKSNAVQSIVGSIKQFNTEDRNSIIPDMKLTAVTAHYFFTEQRKNWRKNRLIARYKSRSMWAGTPEYVLNTEELATIWHFPVTVARQPMLSQTASKKSEAPSVLPTDVVNPFKAGKAHEAVKSEPPANLPT